MKRLLAFLLFTYTAIAVPPVGELYFSKFGPNEDRGQTWRADTVGNVGSWAVTVYKRSYTGYHGFEYVGTFPSTPWAGGSLYLTAGVEYCIIAHRASRSDWNWDYWQSPLIWCRLWAGGTWRSGGLPQGGSDWWTFTVWFDPDETSWSYVYLQDCGVGDCYYANPELYFGSIL